MPKKERLLPPLPKDHWLYTGWNVVGGRAYGLDGRDLGFDVVVDCSKAESKSSNQTTETKKET